MIIERTYTQRGTYQPKVLVDGDLLAVLTKREREGTGLLLQVRTNNGDEQYTIELDYIDAGKLYEKLRAVREGKRA